MYVLALSCPAKGASAAVLSDGQAGVAMHTEGESVPRMFETLVGLPAAEAARAVLSWNFEEASEGMAVVNACLNRPTRMEALNTFYTGSVLEGLELHGKTVGFVGHLLHHSGITEGLVQAAKGKPAVVNSLFHLYSPPEAYFYRNVSLIRSDRGLRCAPEERPRSALSDP